jgi:hypothetical protein
MPYLHHSSRTGILGRASNPNGRRFLTDNRVRFSLISGIQGIFLFPQAAGQGGGGHQPQPRDWG